MRMLGNYHFIILPNFFLMKYNKIDKNITRNNCQINLFIIILEDIRLEEKRSRILF